MGWDWHRVHDVTCSQQQATQCSFSTIRGPGCPPPFRYSKVALSGVLGLQLGIQKVFKYVGFTPLSRTQIQDRVKLISTRRVIPRDHIFVPPTVRVVLNLVRLLRARRVINLEFNELACCFVFQCLSVVLQKTTGQQSLV